MSIRTVPQTGRIVEEIEVLDRYGEPQVIRKSRRGYQVQRKELSPVLVLNKEIAAIVGQRIRAERQKQGRTLEELATSAGLRDVNPKQRMWRIENSILREGITIGTVYTVAMALGVEATNLLPTVAEIAEFVAPKTVKQTVVAVR